MNPTVAESALRILRTIRLPRHCHLRAALARALRAHRCVARAAAP